MFKQPLNNRQFAEWKEQAQTLTGGLIEGLKALAERPGSQVRFECTHYDGDFAIWAGIKTNIIGKKGNLIHAAIGSSSFTPTTPRIYYDLYNAGILLDKQTKKPEKALRHIAARAKAQGLVPK